MGIVQRSLVFVALAGATKSIVQLNVLMGPIWRVIVKIRKVIIIPKLDERVTNGAKEIIVFGKKTKTDPSTKILKQSGITSKYSCVICDVAVFVVLALSPTREGFFQCGG